MTRPNEAKTTAGIFLLVAAAMLALYFVFMSTEADAQQATSTIDIPINESVCGLEPEMDKQARELNILTIGRGNRVGLELQFDTDNGDFFLVIRDQGVVCILEYFPGDGGAS